MNCRAQLITLLFAEAVVGLAWREDAHVAYWTSFFSGAAAMVYLLLYRSGSRALRKLMSNDLNERRKHGR